MQRRSFLGALMGLAAAPVLARLAPVYEIPKDLVILPTLPVDGRIFQISMRGLADEPKSTFASILSQNGLPVLRYAINANGGNLLWCPIFDQNIVFTQDHPLVFDVDDDVDFSMVYHHKEEVRIRRICRGVVTDMRA